MATTSEGPRLPRFVVDRLPHDHELTDDGRAAKFCCPAHTDNSPSAQVRAEDDGGISAKCFAGCTHKALIAALGLPWQDLQSAAKQAEYGSTEDLYTYYGTDHALAYVIARLRLKGEKSYRPRRLIDGEWVAKLPDECRILYNLPRVLGAVASKQTIYVVEGEKNADALTKTGVVATTNPFGAGKWRDGYSTALSGATVTVVADNDRPGRQHAQQVKASLEKAGCTVTMMRAPLDAEGSDAADLLAAGGTLDQLVPLTLDTVDAPPAFSDDELDETARLFQLLGVHADDDAPRPISRTLAEIMADPGANTPPVAVIPYLAWGGRLTMLAAREKSGKSTLVAAGVAALTRGHDFLDTATSAASVLWVTLEEHSTDLGQRAVRFGTHPDRLHVMETPTMPIWDKVIERTQTLKPAVVVIDTLMEFGAQTELVKDSSAASQLVVVMKLFRTLARETGAAVIVLHHARKSDGTFAGSFQSAAGVDVVIEMFVTHPDRPERRLTSVGRFGRHKFTVALNNDAYRLGVGDGPSLKDRVYQFVRTHPGAGVGAIRTEVGSKHAAAGAALEQLRNDGHVKNQSLNSKRAEYVVTDKPYVPEGTDGPRDDDAADEPEGRF